MGDSRLHVTPQATAFRSEGTEMRLAAQWPTRSLEGGAQYHHPAGAGSAPTVIGLAVALLLAVPFALGSLWSIVSAWVACFEVGLGVGFFAVAYLTAVMGVASLVFAVAILFGPRIPLLISPCCRSRRIHARVRGVGIMVLFDGGAAEGPTRCGPSGIPAWWPGWLPT